MKKSLVFLLAIIMLFVFAGCTSPAASSSQPVQSVSVSSEPQASTSAAAPAGDATIEEMVLVDQDGIKITALSLDLDNTFGPELKVLVENNTDKAITVQVRDVSINGMMVDSIFSCDVEPGKKSNSAITFMGSSLEKNGIVDIGTIELKFHAFNSDSHDLVFDTEDIVIETSLAGAVGQSTPESATVIYDQDGIKISFVAFDPEAFMGLEVKFIIENNTDTAITVQARDTSINGFMVDGIMSSEVMPGKTANDELTFLSSSLEDNNIDEIESVELKFHIFESDTHASIADTDIITLTP